MRILNATCFQNTGGVNQVFCDYTKVLQDNGHEVALLISNNFLNNYQGSKVFKLRNICPAFDFLHLLWVIAVFRPNVIFCHAPRVMKLMRFVKLIPNLKTIGINHGKSFKHSKNCDYVISVNKQISQDLINSGFNSDDAFVVQNAVHLSEKYRAKVIKAVPTIGIYGRVESGKGFDILIQAAGELKRQNIDFRLKIGGFEVPGSNYTFQNLEDLARDEDILEKCDFVGLVTDKKEFFADVDLFCVPSRHESFGMVILEGFLFSTLVISSVTDGGQFLIQDNENGLLFENENSDELAQKIKYALANEDLLQEMTRKAFLRLEKDFSFDSLAVEMERIINFVTKK